MRAYESITGRRWAALIAACLASVILVTLVKIQPASAHASIGGNPNRPTNSDISLTLRVPIEPSEFPGQIPDESQFYNQRVRMSVPAGFTVNSCPVKTGWTCVVETTPDRRIVWTNNSGDVNGFDDSFIFNVHTANTAGPYYFPVLQDYAGCTPSACSSHWDIPEDSDHPAPKVILVAPTTTTTAPTTTTTTAPPATTTTAPPTTTTAPPTTTTAPPTTTTAPPTATTAPPTTTTTTPTTTTTAPSTTTTTAPPTTTTTTPPSTTTTTAPPATTTTTSGPPSGQPDQTIVVTVPASEEFALTIDGDGKVNFAQVNGETDLRFIGALDPVVLTDRRASKPAWSVSGQVGNFGPPANVIDGKHLGWSPLVVTPGAGALAGGFVPPGIGGAATDGLKTSRTLASAVAGHDPGTATLGAQLDLRLPVGTPAGTYIATLTLTAI